MTPKRRNLPRPGVRRAGPGRGLARQRYAPPAVARVGVGPGTGRLLAPRFQLNLDARRGPIQHFAESCRDGRYGIFGGGGVSAWGVVKPVLRWTWRVPGPPGHRLPGAAVARLVLVKWWLLAIPQYIIVGLFVGGGVWAASRAGQPGLQPGRRADRHPGADRRGHAAVHRPLPVTAVRLRARPEPLGAPSRGPVRRPTTRRSRGGPASGLRDRGRAVGPAGPG